MRNEAAVHLRHVDPAFDAVGERVERPDQIMPIDAEVEREVVARAGGNVDERKLVLEGGRHDGEDVTGDAERVGAPRFATSVARSSSGVTSTTSMLAVTREPREAGARGLAATSTSG